MWKMWITMWKTFKKIFKKVIDKKIKIWYNIKCSRKDYNIKERWYEYERGYIFKIKRRFL